MIGPGARSALSGSRFGDIRWVEETGSTNSDLLALARQGAPEGLVLGAERQHAGRGRLGRSWVAPPGSSLLVSILLRPPADVDPHQATVAVALAARAACAEVAAVRPELKWPNDLLVDDRKVAGVLAESVVERGRVRAVVVGIGLNVNWPTRRPPDLAEILVALGDVADATVDREELLVAVLRHLDERWPPSADLTVEYRDALATIGRRVRVDLGETEIEGEAVDVDPSGHLVVQTDAGCRTVAAADVTHLR